MLPTIIAENASQWQEERGIGKEGQRRKIAGLLGAFYGRMIGNSVDRRNRSRLASKNEERNR